MIKMGVILKKDWINTFAQRKYIIMMLVFSIGIPCLIPTISGNSFLQLFSVTILAYIIPCFTSIICSSQLVINNYLEDIKSNISLITLYSRINMGIYIFSKVVYAVISGSICAIISMLSFHFFVQNITNRDMLYIIIISALWSIASSLLSFLLTTLKLKNEIILTYLMMVVTYGFYACITYISSPVDKMALHIILVLIISILSVLISLIFIKKAKLVID
ncbi:hypothetical protein A5821_001692 [Enterococcus sp. 7F3_DIV0205]|uniref:ABC-2 type transporter domain-containing protein n=1 Tax=Candidatus Enterococcus palustris TaxID=1834189 RepID=A0AAQ3Y750_9ENTE|nr:hypothetical protein [Enterococcus sp. 7F3_DIV0205]OTN86087.1 hypothetical protein A5821_002037 [Enterococcus sp. 7F3_DIV0205]